MPPTQRLTAGVLRVGDRTANIHPEGWDPKVSHYRPLDTYPLTLTLDNMPSGGVIPSRVWNWFEKPFNSLTGSITDIYTTNNVVSGTGVSGTPAAGTTVYVKPDSTGFTKIRNLKEYDNVEIYSSSVRGRISGYVTAVHVGTAANSWFSVVTDATDSSSVLAGTGLSWTITGRGEEEVHELGDSISEHETQFYNYVATMEEAHTISEDELNEDSRLEEDVKKDKEMESLQRLNQRRELMFLEGHRRVLGDRYFAGGLRYFLNTYESANIVDWRTDTTYSASTDTVLGGIIPFTKRLSQYTRQWSPVGTRKILLCSQTVRGILDEAVLNSGQYRIDYETKKYGLNVAVLKGLDQEIEIMEEPLFNSNPAKTYTVYMIEPGTIMRRTVKNGKLMRIPWSGLGQAGDEYKTYIKGGWRVKETYQFKRIASHAIIENFGLDKV